MLTMQRLSVYITNEYRIDLKDEKPLMSYMLHCAFSLINGST